MIGWLFLLVPIAIVGYAGIRLAPVYLNYMKVVRSIDRPPSSCKKTSRSMRPRYAIRSRSTSISRASISRRSRMSIVRRDGKAWVIEATYEDVAPLFANLSLLVKFDKAVHDRVTERCRSVSAEWPNAWLRRQAGI